MKYKLAGLSIVLLLATPAYGQKVSPVIVETPRTLVPTVVKTGESFKQTYVLKFFDSSDEFESITIDEDSLGVSSLGPFEVLGLNISKRTKQADYLENVWDLEYTFRIINEKKSADLAQAKEKPYMIPSITISWTGKRVGSQDVVTNTEIKTQEVYVNYVSTVTDEDPYVFIRDNVNFGDFSGLAFWFKISFWALSVIVPGFFILTLILIRRSKRKAIKDPSSAEDKTEDASVAYAEAISRKRALRKLRKAVKRLKNFGSGKNVGAADEIMHGLCNSILDLLRTEVPGSSIGTTPSEMILLISDMPTKPSVEGLAFLAKKAFDYRFMIESSSVDEHWPQEPVSDAESLYEAIGKLSWRYRLLSKFKKLVRR